ncbi:MAG: ribosome maturation factor RimM [Phototrophicaceae bacterium]
MAKDNLSPKYLALGKILRPHGIRGEIRMKILTDYPERFINDLKTIYLGEKVTQDNADAYSLKSARFHKDFLLITLDEVKSRNDAETLRGKMVMIDIDNAVPLEDGEFYLYQLIGLTVQTDDGIELGQLKEVIETGANDVYIVKGREFGEVLLPAHEETIVSIDFEAKLITMTLPEGLLPDTPSK